jgi:repressor LexA
MLTKTQKKIYNFIGEYTEKYGYAPSLTEIGQEFGVSTPSTVHKHISNLIEKGLLKKSKGVARSVELVNLKTTEFMAIPIIGIIAAGSPIEAIEVPEMSWKLPKIGAFKTVSFML